MQMTTADNTDVAAPRASRAPEYMPRFALGTSATSERYLQSRQLMWRCSSGLMISWP